MNVFRKISVWSSGMGRVFRNELRVIFHDFGVLLFFFGLTFLYPVVYTLIYNPEVTRKLPVAVVDDSRSAESRDFVQRASASPAIDIYTYCNDMNEARAVMAANDCFAIIKIPYDYGKNIGRGEPAHVEMFFDMSLLLRYRTLLSAMTDLQVDMINNLTGERISAAGLTSYAASGALPIQSESNFLGDTEQGFASFIIPGIVILILQQGMLLGITFLGGTANERRRRNGGIDPEAVNDAGPMATIWGRTFAYVLVLIPSTVYVMRIIPEIFNLPHYGSPVDYYLFIFPMLLATAFMGQTLNLIMKERESAFIIWVFTSVIFLFLSGLTWPRYAMGPLWTALGDCVPAVWGVEGFIRINSNAASLSEVSRPYVWMWILTGVYMITAYFTVKYIRSKERRLKTVKTQSNGGY